MCVMYKKRNDPWGKNILRIFILLSGLFVFAYSETRADSVKSEVLFLEINLKERNEEIYQEIRSHYGNFWIRAYRSAEEFEFYSKKHFYVKEIQYFYKTDNKDIYLGKADKSGVFDKENKLLKKCPPLNNYEVLGFTEYILKSPFYLGMYVLDKGKYGSLDPYIIPFIDFRDNTIAVKKIE